MRTKICILTLSSLKMFAILTSVYLGIWLTQGETQWDIKNRNEWQIKKCIGTIDLEFIVYIREQTYLAQFIGNGGITG